jgi:hypothetical protein
MYAQDMKQHQQAKSVYHHDRRQLRQAWAIVPGFVAARMRGKWRLEPVS